MGRTSCVPLIRWSFRRKSDYGVSLRLRSNLFYQKFLKFESSSSEFGVLSPFRHDPASAPRQPARAVLPLLLCRTALAPPPSHSFLFGAILIFFFRYGGGGARDGFLLEGEPGGIHSVIISFFVVLTNGRGKAKLFLREEMICFASAKVLI